jgi:hypothetical protein
MAVMTKKPTTAEGYDSQMAVEARRMCLYLATILGDLIDEVVVVGGLVPYLIINQAGAQERHVGTRDLDLGLSLALLDDERYREVSDRLRDRGFGPGKTDEGRVTRQTWVHHASSISIDFLIPRSDDGPAPGKLQNLEGDFAAIVTAALPLSFRDVVAVTIDDSTPFGEAAKRTVQVSGPAAFVVLKAHALRLRGENKDAYDLVYVLKNYGGDSTEEVAQRFEPIAESDEAKEALDILAEDFASPGHLGPTRAAEFLTGRHDDEAQADAYGYVQEFLSRVRR